jgi:hypothetical protein
MVSRISSAGAGDIKSAGSIMAADISITPATEPKTIKNSLVEESSFGAILTSKICMRDPFFQLAAQVAS